MSSEPDSWAIAASSLPLAFAQVREDPRLDLELARGLSSGSKVVMIASGGDTAVCLGRLPLSLHLVDLNPAQLALSRLKWQLAEDGNLEETARLLGHLPMPVDERRTKLSEKLAGLNLEPSVLGPIDFVAQVGPDQAGRYELTFEKLREKLTDHRRELDELLLSPIPIEGFHLTGAGQAVEVAFREVMSLGNLVQLFGNEATQNPRRAFSEHFADRTNEAFRTMPPRSNPFLWQILAGRFHPDHPYDWLTRESFDGKRLTEDIHWHQGKMDQLLESFPDQEMDLVHLSNILDWLSPDAAGKLLQQVSRVLKPNGRVIIRQLNSTVDIAAIDVGLTWNIEMGKRMEHRDRSYFYPGIFIGRRR